MSDGVLSVYRPEYPFLSWGLTPLIVGPVQINVLEDIKNFDGWKQKGIEEWSSFDTMYWLVSELCQHVADLATIKLESFFHTNGIELKKKSWYDLNEMIPGHGQKLYYQLQKIIGNAPTVRGILSQPLIQTEEPYKLTDRDTRSHSSIPTYLRTVRKSGNRDIEHFDGWKHKRVEEWSSFDTMYWLVSELRQHVADLAAIKLETFQHTSGIELKKKTLDDFNKITPECGLKLYYQLQTITNLSLTTCRSLSQPLTSNQEPCDLTDPDTSCSSIPTHLKHIEEDTFTTNIISEMALREGKRKPGRPRGSVVKRKSNAKIGRVWEFIRDLLMDPQYNPSVVAWVDRQEGVFQFTSSEQAAKLWGHKRKNLSMNFQNFSRSIRQNYKKGYLLSVEKRLVYMFGPISSGWRLST